LAISETTRREMHARLVDALGTEAADTLMEYLPPVGWADVATKHDLDRFATKEDLQKFNSHVSDQLNQQTRTLLLGSAAMMAATISAVSALISVAH
jgi:hypothetical protein